MSERCIIAFSRKNNNNFLPVNQQSEKAQINSDLYIVFYELLCIESQEDFSQQFVPEESWQGSGTA